MHASGAVAGAHSRMPVVCAGCGSEYADAARFCSSCGAKITASSAEVRKTVSVLFCDHVGSTAMGGGSDPEVVRARMLRYHADLRTVLERHGGTVEKFIGDAAMAVFGIPTSHEDDALRAVRAAVDARRAVAAAGLEVRIGVNTGPVVAAVGETLLTGDAVNACFRYPHRSSKRAIHGRPGGFRRASAEERTRQRP
jgi:class 3 adenylate cyclase